MSLKKQKYLTLYEKSLVIQGLNNGQSVTFLAKKYGVAKSTICKIKQKRELISKTVRNTYLGPGKRKTLKRSDFPKMEDELYKWFLKQRSENVIVSGEMIKQKAKLIHSEIYENDKEFTASEGWLQRFKKRFGISFLKVPAEEKSSYQQQLVDPFINIGNNEQTKGTGGIEKSLYIIGNQSQLFIDEEQPSTSTIFHPDKTKLLLQPVIDVKETIIIKQEGSQSNLSQKPYENYKDDVTSFMNNSTIKEEPDDEDFDDGDNFTEVIVKDEPQSPGSHPKDSDQGRITNDIESKSDLLEIQKVERATQANMKPKMRTVSVQTSPMMCECFKIKTLRMLE